MNLMPILIMVILKSSCFWVQLSTKALPDYVKSKETKDAASFLKECCEQYISTYNNVFGEHEKTL